jgi:hypothetical protein
VDAGVDWDVADDITDEEEVEKLGLERWDWWCDADAVVVVDEVAG